MVACNTSSGIALSRLLTLNTVPSSGVLAVSPDAPVDKFTSFSNISAIEYNSIGTINPNSASDGIEQKNSNVVKEMKSAGSGYSFVGNSKPFTTLSMEDEITNNSAASATKRSLKSSSGGTKSSTDQVTSSSAKHSISFGSSGGDPVRDNDVLKGAQSSSGDVTQGVRPFNDDEKQEESDDDASAKWTNAQREAAKVARHKAQEQRKAQREAMKKEWRKLKAQQKAERKAAKERAKSETSATQNAVASSNSTDALKE
ncbi:hypothetical protein CCR75_003690 [Bremia lactucae]|uniref:Uncharacterized protein n=1 Tax=Bremia lactucae TaxID=4779 RepID=A0A976NY57_BRELC|nr:hypothetical protein CCR75_003690 [Bremia lactucae]